MKKLPVPLVLLALAILLSLWLLGRPPEFAPAEGFSLVRYDGRYAAAYAVTPERAEVLVKTLADAVTPSFGPGKAQTPGDIFCILEGYDGPDSWGIWNNGWLLTDAGKYLRCPLDWEAALADWPYSSLDWAQVPRKAEIASMFDRWNTALLVPGSCDALPGIQSVIAAEGPDSFTVRLTGTGDIPRQFEDTPRLEVLVGDVWYRLPEPLRAPAPEVPIAPPALNPGQMTERTVTISAVLRDYPRLLPGRCRICVYGTAYAFDH